MAFLTVRCLASFFLFLSVALAVPATLHRRQAKPNTAGDLLWIKKWAAVGDSYAVRSTIRTIYTRKLDI
jgi:hypothetical protein